MVSSLRVRKLRAAVRRLYTKNNNKLLMNGWHHINFVSKKAVEFARPIKADIFLVESAGLLHDLNYVVRVNSEPEIGASLRKAYLIKAGYPLAEVERIESIIMESHTRTRTRKISKEGMALSDADTLFKALPTTPILFTSKYIDQNRVDIGRLAHKIVSEQNKLMKKGIYFYTDLAKRKYLGWAKINLALWNNVNEALKDGDIAGMLRIANKAGSI